MAGSAHTLTSHSIPRYTKGIGKVVSAFTADDGDGSIPALTVTFPYDAVVLAIGTNPGATAPTDNYDIVLADSDGFDRLNGAGINRDTANTETAAVSSGFIQSGDSLALTPTGNSVNSATGVIAVWYQKAY